MNYWKNPLNKFLQKPEQIPERHSQEMEASHLCQVSLLHLVATGDWIPATNEVLIHSNSVRIHVHDHAIMQRYTHSIESSK